jgi:CheY-like chemotaxis protein
VILLDIGLPELNGYETAKRIRATQSGRDLLLVALTGWGKEEDRRRSEEAGFDTHLVKPVNLNHLAKVLAHSGGGK